MGRDDGGLKLSSAPTGTDEVLALYEEVARDGEFDVVIPKDCIVIAYMGVCAFEVSLELSGVSEPRVIFSSGHEKKGACAESLEKLLYRTAFWHYELRSMRCLRVYRFNDPATSPAIAARWLEDLGFEPEWFSDDICVCARRGGVLCALEQITYYAPYPIDLVIRAPDDERLASFESQLRAIIPVELRRQVIEGAR
jgi:hypothetical protein